MRNNVLNLPQSLVEAGLDQRTVRSDSPDSPHSRIMREPNFYDSPESTMTINPNRKNDDTKIIVTLILEWLYNMEKYKERFVEEHQNMKIQDVIDMLKYELVEFNSIGDDEEMYKELNDIRENFEGLGGEGLDSGLGGGGLDPENTPRTWQNVTIARILRLHREIDEEEITETLIDGIQHL